MGRIVLDADLRSKLNGFHESAELVDEAGNVVGEVVHFDTIPDETWEPPMKPYEYGPYDPGKCVSSEELLRGLRDK